MSQTQICVLHMQLVIYLEHVASVFLHQVLAEYTHIFVSGSFIVILLSFLTPN